MGSSFLSTNSAVRAAMLLAAGALLCSVPVVAAPPTYSAEPSGEFLTEWLLCGPFALEEAGEWATESAHLRGFSVDFLEAAGGERAIRPEEGQSVEARGQSAAWLRHKSDDFSIDLDATLGKQESVVGYAYCEVESDREKLCVLSIGTNDGGRMWLNGERIWDRPEGRGMRPDDDQIAVVLRKGSNTLLLKVEERGNLWGFCTRFLPLDPDTFFQDHPLFSVQVNEEGKATARSMYPRSVGKAIIREAHLSVSTQGVWEHTVWEADWEEGREMSLVLPQDYGEYTLNAEVTLLDGMSWTATLPFAAGKRVEQVLFEGGKTDYRIVVGENASESERWAAQELQHWLREVSGAEFPIHSGTEPIVEREIVLGVNGHSRDLLNEDAPPPDQNDESFCYQNVGPSIVIVGGAARGTMYGVMTFLERELGCRWYTSRVTVAPKRDRFAFDALHHADAPGIRVRNDFYYEAFEPIWAARNKVNGAMGYREQPGGIECYWSVHTFFPLMPPSEFFAEHPEYYSLIGGERIHDRAQLCLTNPDVLRIITERLRERMRQSPEYLIYSVSQNDWRQPCQCNACQAIAEREGSESGPLIWFVNQVADAVKEEFPDKFVGTLAYQYTRKPCKTLRPRENVVIRFCSIECCFAHPFTECPENESFVEDLEGWAAISPHLYVWDYVVNFSHYTMPYPNFRVLQPNLQKLRDNKAIGIMEQAAYQSRGGEFAELRAYLISKLLWNPECDVEDVINDFMYGYYGRAGQHVRAYFDLLHNRLEHDTHIHLGLSPDDKLFSETFIRDAEALFDKAEAVADNVEIRQRVEMARLPIMYLKCRRTPVQAKYDGTYQRFCDIVAREGITLYAERGGPHKEAFHQAVEAAK